MEAPRGRTDKALQNTSMRGFEITRSARNNSREVRLRCRIATVASLQSQSLAYIALLIRVVDRAGRRVGHDL